MGVHDFNLFQVLVRALVVTLFFSPASSLPKRSNDEDASERIDLGFDFLKKIVTESSLKDVDLSDGTNLNVTQPSLKLQDWFLTQDEITASRGGIPRHGLHAYTTGNRITVFSVSKAFFSSLVRDFRATKAGDRVMITAWDSCLVPLDPELDPSGTTTGFDVLVQGMVQRGTSVHALVWANVLLPFQNLAVRNAMNKIRPSPINDAQAVFLFDDRLPLPSSSQHQKTIIIAANASTRNDEYPIAYVGGLDVSNDRWDTIHHNNTALREQAKINAFYKGWIDAHFRIHGPAANDVANNFLQRWNAKYTPCQGLDDNLLDFRNPKCAKLPPLAYATGTHRSNKVGTHNVQIVRTFSCLYQHNKEFAPRGEQSLFVARIKAIKKAKNFIYIEDQYFIYVPELLEALLEVLPRIQRLIVVLQYPDAIMKASGYGKYLYEMVHPLTKQFPNKVQIYATKPELNIYVHTKLVIIDDVYVSLGSANWNRRSMTSDSELNANVIDDATVESPDGITVLQLARDMRIRKFVEMTGRSYEDLDAMTLIEAAEEFKLAAKDDASILMDVKVGYQLYHEMFVGPIREQIDPQEVCQYSGSHFKKDLQ